MSNDELNLKIKQHLLEQAKHESNLRHKWKQESHWDFQKWIWIGTVVLLAIGIIVSGLK